MKIEIDERKCALWLAAIIWSGTMMLIGIEWGKSQMRREAQEAGAGFWGFTPPKSVEWKWNNDTRTKI